MIQKPIINTIYVILLPILHIIYRALGAFHIAHRIRQTTAKFLSHKPSKIITLHRDGSIKKKTYRSKISSAAVQRSHCTLLCHYQNSHNQPITSQVKWHPKVPTVKLFVYRKQRAYRRKCDSAVSSWSGKFIHIRPPSFPSKIQPSIHGRGVARESARRCLFCAFGVEPCRFRVTELSCSTCPPLGKF